MADITSKFASDIIVLNTGRHVVRRKTVMADPSRDLDVVFVIHDRVWIEPRSTSKFGPICGSCRSQDEAEHWIEGVESGQFVSIPLPNEFALYPGLEERVKGGS